MNQEETLKKKKYGNREDFQEKGNKTKQNTTTVIQGSFPNIKVGLNYILKEHTMYLRISTRIDQNQDIV